MHRASIVPDEKIANFPEVMPSERFRFILDTPIRELDRAAFNYMLSTRFNAPTLRTVQQFRATKIPTDVCAVIDVDAGTMGMHWELYGYTYRDAPISYQHVYVPPAEARLQIAPRRPHRFAIRRVARLGGAC